MIYLAHAGFDRQPPTMPARAVRPQGPGFLISSMAADAAEGGAPARVPNERGRRHGTTTRTCLDEWIPHWPQHRLGCSLLGMEMCATP